MAEVAALLPRNAAPAVLRRLAAGDVARFHAYRSDPAVGRFQGWSPMTEAQASAFIAEMGSIELFRPGEWAQLAIADAATDRLVGDLGLYLGESGEIGEIGFTLSTRSRGKGYATAAAREAVSLFFEQTSVRQVIGITDARNTPSVAVLERVGFERTEVREVVFRGEPCIEWVYAVCRRRIGSIVSPCRSRP